MGLRFPFFFQLLDLSRYVSVLHIGFGEQLSRGGQSVSICDVAGVVRLACSSLGIQQVSANDLAGIAGSFGGFCQAGCYGICSPEESTSHESTKEEPPHQRIKTFESKNRAKGAG